MPKGNAGIASLQLETLNKLIQKMPNPPVSFFSGMFPTVQAESDSIKWEIEYGSGGMTPFVTPGSVAPAVGLDGLGEGSAKAAYWKEKMYLDEVLLNNLRQPGTHASKQAAERVVARGTQKLRNRCFRRREWMCAQALTTGQIAYSTAKGMRFTVSYGLPTSHVVTLASDRKWNTGANRNPIEDIMLAKEALIIDASVTPDYAMCNSAMIRMLTLDDKIQGLLMKSAYGNGDLFGPKKATVLADLLGLDNLVVYDEFWENQAYLTAALSSSTTVYVDDASDFEVGGTLRFFSMSGNTWEDKTITAVSLANGTLTIDSNTTANYAVGDKVTMRKKFITDDKFIMFSSKNGDGTPIGEFMESPFGTPARYGFYADVNDEWDPEGLWLRVQNKGLPVIYNPDTIYIYTVK